MLGKLKSMVSQLRGDVIAFAPIKAMMVKFEGAGVSNPVIQTSYNINSIIRTGVGVYRITLIQGTIYGKVIDTFGVPAVGSAIQASPNSDAHSVKILTISSTVFDVFVTEIVQGTGNRLDFNPYDIVAGDKIGLSLLLTVREELPPA